MALGRKTQREETEDSKVVEISAEMQGSLYFKDPVNLKINGNFSGNLDTRGTLTIGNTAKVIANIKGDNIVVAGKIKGDITAKKMLVLMPTAVLEGNINAPKLNIVEGAIFQGNCSMKSEGYATAGFGANDLLDITEVSKYLEIDIAEIEALANSGKIPGRKEGGTWKFERAAIDKWVSSEQISS
jgi:excisionase family DNA binding protein